MTALLVFIFLGLSLAAAGFAVWPVLRRKGLPAKMLAVAVTFAILGVGLGTYVMLGSPGLALRTLTGAQPDDLAGLIAELSLKVRSTPGNPKGWTLLGQGYLTLGDGADAAAAFKKAAQVAPPAQRPALLSAYGEALVQASAGAVTPEAEAVFETVLQANPKDRAARYFLGLAYASRGENGKAEAMWQSLLAEATTPKLRSALIDRLAALKAGNGRAPDIAAMVAQLAARLASHPQDPEGWQRLIRAYAVLGEEDKARQALADAHAALKDNKAAIAAIDEEAKALKIAQ